MTLNRREESGFTDDALRCVRLCAVVATLFEHRGEVVNALGWQGRQPPPPGPQGARRVQHAAPEPPAHPLRGLCPPEARSGRREQQTHEALPGGVECLERRLRPTQRGEDVGGPPQLVGVGPQPVHRVDHKVHAPPPDVELEAGVHDVPDGLEAGEGAGERGCPGEFPVHCVPLDARLHLHPQLGDHVSDKRLLLVPVRAGGPIPLELQPVPHEDHLLRGVQVDPHEAAGVRQARHVPQGEAQVSSVVKDSVRPHQVCLGQAPGGKEVHVQYAAVDDAPSLPRLEPEPQLRARGHHVAEPPRGARVHVHGDHEAGIQVDRRKRSQPVPRADVEEGEPLRGSEPVALEERRDKSGHTAVDSAHWDVGREHCCIGNAHRRLIFQHVV
mmetsp:Transcript_72342/g.228620  ORF Transcript_72342/g.228620 Transcript_72342/m.228620 type:complete len:385 (+) Transcript_72342:240-1394(+)